MKKFIAIIILVFILLFNYHLISFQNGFKTVFTSKQPEKELISMIHLLESTDSIVYYQHPFNDKYVCIVNSKDYGITIFEVTKNEILALDIAGIINSNLKPRQIYPIPLLIYLATAILIVFYPFSSKKKSKSK